MTSPQPIPASSKVPPKFVPTLTEVVQLPAGLRSTRGLAQAVPHSVTEASSLPLADPVADTAPAELNAAGAINELALSELLVHRVMQRVDEHLARDLRVAVAQLVVSHMQSLTPLLRTEIDRVVRTSVEAALVKELSANS